MMSDLVGIVRSDRRLRLAKQKEEEIYKAVKEIYNFSLHSAQLSELRNLVSVAWLIITQASNKRK